MPFHSTISKGIIILCVSLLFLTQCTEHSVEPEVIDQLHMDSLYVDSLNSDQLNTRIQELNKRYHFICKQYGAGFIDTYSMFLDDNGLINYGLYKSDGIHINSEAYEIWIENSLRPYILNEQIDSVIMVGNSITNSIGEYTPPSGIYSTWERVLNIPAYNFAISGDESIDVLHRISTIKTHKGKYVFVLIGTNDILEGIEDNEICDNVKNIVSELTAANKKVVIQAIMPMVTRDNN